MTETYDYFKQRIIHEAFIRYAPQKPEGFIDPLESVWPFAFPLSEVLEAYAYVRRLLDESDGKVKRRWDATLAQLARIILDERNQAEIGELENI